MKKYGKRMGLPGSMLLFGIVAMLLRRQLYLTAVDIKGLLPCYSLMEALLLLLTAAAACILFLVLRKDRGSNRFEDNYSASIPGALGHVAAATGIFMMVRWSVPGLAGYLGSVWQLLGYVAPVCLIAAGISRSLGKKPFFLLHVIPCLFLLVHVVSCYQTWSSNPQMQDYLFALLANLALILFAHHTAAFEAGLGNRKMVLGAGMAAVYLCLAELGWTEQPNLYFGGMLWALTGVCNMLPGAAEEKE